jgi:hypothetical protein
MTFGSVHEAVPTRHSTGPLITNSLTIDLVSNAAVDLLSASEFCDHFRLQSDATARQYRRLEVRPSSWCLEDGNTTPNEGEIAGRLYL